jgi:hypothetical protein
VGLKHHCQEVLMVLLLLLLLLLQIVGQLMWNVLMENCHCQHALVYVNCCCYSVCCPLH